MRKRMLIFGLLLAWPGCSESPDNSAVVLDPGAVTQNNRGVGLRLLLGRWGTVAKVGPLEETIGADLSRFLETQECGKEAHPKKC